MPKPPKPLHIAGTTLEGGGQIVRLSLGLAALTGKPLHITAIRGNRSGGGGLKLQHLKAVEWLAEACAADLDGAHKGSQELHFTPGKQIGKLRNTIDIGSPGSVCLVTQAILPYLFWKGHSLMGSDGLSRVRITGGTNVGMSPSVDYMQHVLFPMLAKIGLEASLKVEKRGWTAGGLGGIELQVRPIPAGKTLPQWSMHERGIVTRIEAHVVVPRAHWKRMEEEISKQLGKHDMTTDIDIIASDSCHDRRWYFLLIAVTENGYRIGRDSYFEYKMKDQFKIPPKLVERVVRDFKIELAHCGCVDEHLRDQLVVFQTLADGDCAIDVGTTASLETLPPSLHAETAIWVSKHVVKARWGGQTQCSGISLTAPEAGAAEENGLASAVSKLEI